MSKSVQGETWEYFCPSEVGCKLMPAMSISQGKRCFHMGTFQWQKSSQYSLVFYFQKYDLFLKILLLNIFFVMMIKLQLTTLFYKFVILLFIMF